jgi:hypothetical protein
MAEIERRTHDERERPADTVLTLIVARASVGIVARRAVQLDGCAAQTSERIAGTDVVTRVAGGAGHRIGSDALARLTGVVQGAVVEIAARRVVSEDRVRALAGRGIARSDVVAIVAGTTNHGPVDNVTMSSGIAILVTVAGVSVGAGRVLWSGEVSNAGRRVAAVDGAWIPVIDGRSDARHAAP